MKKNSAKNFDHIDMVFVQGEPNLLPWSPQISKVAKIFHANLKL